MIKSTYIKQCLADNRSYTNICSYYHLGQAVAHTESTVNISQMNQLRSGVELQGPCFAKGCPA
jgi:hypothetical protein